MKILHTSDWHLGKSIYGHSLIEDQSYFIESVFLKAVKEENPDMVILAGDIYDRQIAPVEAIKLFDRVIIELNKMNVPILCISGNHDGGDRLAIGASLLKEKGIHIASRIEDAFKPVSFSKNNIKTDVYLLSHFEIGDAKFALQNSEIKNFEEAYYSIINKIYDNMDKNSINILVSHCFVSGSIESDSESSPFIGGSFAISPKIFKGFDYVALGHLHSPQKVSDNVRYSGAPIKYSFSEAYQEKSLTIAEFDNKKRKVSQIPIKSLNDMEKISGKFDEIIEKGKQNPNRNYIHINLTDDKPIFMPVEQLRHYYPNLLELSSDWLRYGIISDMDIRPNRNLEDDLSIFKTFMSDICGVNADEDDIKIFLEALENYKQEEKEISDIKE